MNVVTTRNLIESRGVNKPELAEELSKIGVPIYSTSSIRWLKIKKLLHADWISHGLSGILLNWIRRVSDYNYKYGVALILMLLSNTLMLLVFALLYQTWTAFYIGAVTSLIAFIVMIVLDNHESGVASWQSGYVVMYDKAPDRIYGKEVSIRLQEKVSRIINNNQTRVIKLSFRFEVMEMSVSGTTRMDDAPTKCNAPIILWAVESKGLGFSSREACIGIIP